MENKIKILCEDGTLYRFYNPECDWPILKTPFDKTRELDHYLLRPQKICMDCKHRHSIIPEEECRVCPWLPERGSLEYVLFPIFKQKEELI